MFCGSLKPHKANLSIPSDTWVCFTATIWRDEGKICGFACLMPLQGTFPLAEGAAGSSLCAHSKEMTFNDELAWILPRPFLLEQDKMMTMSRLLPGTHTQNLLSLKPFSPVCRHSVCPANRMLVSSISSLIGSLGAGIFPAAPSSSSSTCGTSLLLMKM